MIARGLVLVVPVMFVGACSLNLPWLTSIDPGQVSGRWYYLGQKVAWMDVFLRPDKTRKAGSVDGHLSPSSGEGATLSGSFAGDRVAIDLAGLGRTGATAKLDLQFRNGRLEGTVSDSCGRWPAQEAWFELEAPLSNAASSTAMLGGTLDLSGYWVDTANHLRFSLAPDASTASVLTSRCQVQVAQGPLTVDGRTIRSIMPGSLVDGGDPGTTIFEATLRRDPADPVGVRLEGVVVERNAAGAEHRRTIDAYKLGMFEDFGYLACKGPLNERLGLPIPIAAPAGGPAGGLAGGISDETAKADLAPPKEPSVSEDAAVAAASRTLRAYGGDDHYRMDEALVVTWDNSSQKISARNRRIGWMRGGTGDEAKNPFWLVYFRAPEPTRDPCAMSVTVDAYSGRVQGSHAVPWP